MADIQTQAFPGIVSGGNRPSKALFVDSTALINFDRVGGVGALDTLLAANRNVIITKEVEREVVIDALASSNPFVNASGQRIRAWIDSHQDRVQVAPVDPLSEFGQSH